MGTGVIKSFEPVEMYFVIAIDGGSHWRSVKSLLIKGTGRAGGL
jgi:hypothetical protein